MAIATKAITARNSPMSRTRRLERFKLGLPESCDRWQHCSTGERRRDYTKGLGPLGRFGRKSCLTQGDSQGLVFLTYAIRTAPIGTRERARPLPDGPLSWCLDVQPETDLSWLPMLLSLSLTWPPMKIRETMATIAMSPRMSAYSARPWP